MKTRVPDLPNFTRVLVNGYAHIDTEGQPECGRDGNNLAPMTLAQALVFVQPVWCHRCFGHWMGGRQ